MKLITDFCGLGTLLDEGQDLFQLGLIARFKPGGVMEDELRVALESE